MNNPETIADDPEIYAVLRRIDLKLVDRWDKYGHDLSQERQYLVSAWMRRRRSDAHWDEYRGRLAAANTLLGAGMVTTAVQSEMTRAYVRGKLESSVRRMSDDLLVAAIVKSIEGPSLGCLGQALHVAAARSMDVSQAVGEGLARRRALVECRRDTGLMINLDRMCGDHLAWDEVTTPVYLRIRQIDALEARERGLLDVRTTCQCAALLYGRPRHVVTCDQCSVLVTISSPSVGYTVGNAESYDQALAGTEPVYKLGRCLDSELGQYDGGIVWRSPAEARTWLEANPQPWPPAVYRLDMPGPWAVVVELWVDGSGRLLHDALILERVDER